MQAAMTAMSTTEATMLTTRAAAFAMPGAVPAALAVRSAGSLPIGTAGTGATLGCAVGLLCAAAIGATAIGTAMTAATQALVKHAAAPTVATGSVLGATAGRHGDGHQEKQASENRFHQRESFPDRVENRSRRTSDAPLGRRLPPIMFRRPEFRQESDEEFAYAWQQSSAGLISCIVWRSRTIQKFDTTGLDITISGRVTDKVGNLA